MKPTLLFDEIDAIFGPKARDREDLRGMLNAGFERGAVAHRMGGTNNRTLETFNVFAPKVFAGIGELPDTIADRAILIRLERRTRDEQVERFRRRDVEPEGHLLRDRLADWLQPQLEYLRTLRPELPEELDDRAQDIWEPLLAIADLADGDWPERARRAAIVLSTNGNRDDEELTAKLLRDIRTVLEESGDERMRTTDLIDRLAKIEESPWGDWYGKPITAQALSKLLKPFRIRTMSVWVDGEKHRGYKREQFANAFARVLGGRDGNERKVAKAIAGPQRETVILLPRGNGKTHLVGAIAVHHLLTVEGAAIYCAAASREQARVLYEAALGFVRVLDHPNIIDRHLELRWCPDPDRPRAFTRHLRTLAADARLLHGLKPSLAIIDEMHAHPDDEVYIAMRTAMLKRAFAQPDVVRKGAFTDASGPNLRLLEWSLPEDADITDPKVVKTCNPASWITVDGLREQAEAVPELAYRRFHCGQWAEREGHWLPAGAWQACVGTPTIEPGERVWLGVDVGGERAATAVVWINANLHVGVEVFHGDEGVLEAKTLVEELASKYQLVELVFDPWRFGQAAQELRQRGINVIEFPQSDSRMLPASDRLYRAVVEQRLTLPDHPELRQHAANAVARHSRRGWRLDSPGRGVHIDAIIALCMALERTEQQPDEVQLVGWL